MSTGWSSCPSPAPNCPHIETKAPSFVNFCTRWLPSSQTYTLPSGPTEIPRGKLNSPGPAPNAPHFATKTGGPSSATAGNAKRRNADSDTLHMRYLPRSAQGHRGSPVTIILVQHDNRLTASPKGMAKLDIVYPRSERLPWLKFQDVRSWANPFKAL